jgi:hypothetical protein
MLAFLGKKLDNESELMLLIDSCIIRASISLGTDSFIIHIVQTTHACENSQMMNLMNYGVADSFIEDEDY